MCDVAFTVLGYGFQLGSRACRPKVTFGTPGVQQEYEMILGASLHPEPLPLNLVQEQFRETLLQLAKHFPTEAGKSVD